MRFQSFLKKREIWFKLHEKVASKVDFEIGQIEELLASYSELLKRSQTETPNLVDITALGSVLHSFYNGLENIFLTIRSVISGLVHPSYLFSASNCVEWR